MAEHKLSLVDSRIIQTTLVIYICASTGALFSGSWTVFVINLIIATLCGAIFVVLWKKFKNEHKRYFSLFSFVMINSLAVFFATPFLKTIYGSISFWVGLLLTITMVMVPYFFSEEIAFSVGKPNKTRLGRVYTVLTTILFVFGTSLFVDSLYSQNTDLFQATLFILFLVFFVVLVLSTNHVDQTEEDGRSYGGEVII
ncbi:hypothetical protein [Alkalibacillus haloalkaliphilus]|uniref:Uncharacterized protein n=1 Tax=Alkalibacillus haloalkaliphilus TaxID=94136 RepID=A0A511W0B8_9BACI|nr:hypothetical protein [Alkalibacillus haloalkaliphilus]GEN44515.1 hypothetical protein AHA02nite_02910 [Alkalibacillus haloalkaliphilus]